MAASMAATKPVSAAVVANLVSKSTGPESPQWLLLLDVLVKVLMHVLAHLLLHLLLPPSVCGCKI